MALPQLRNRTTTDPTTKLVEHAGPRQILLSSSFTHADRRRRARAADRRRFRRRVG